ncbi:hypothetical protein JAAARDRAFT_36761 [Jaapia argillacea MUCL 33604]|uniref:Fe2OG dioxygenase domain-containing protein n=1 Tax=Jaapia argillacea MUCL 33604 TaxID=933084 RepID=A0A067PQ80_9AGAM|nr:hypothetical protein JAAARDRAFT_36761 [Jaapia argillacea MUCL 33604]
MTISQWQLQGVPATVYYVPDFVSEQEEEFMIRKILGSPRSSWKQLSNRRLQIWGQCGDLTPSNLLLPKKMPPFLTECPDIINRLRNTGVFEESPHGQPNHILLNEYEPGQGIMPHEDGSAYYPVVATISLASHAVFHYYRYQSGHGTTDHSGAISASRGRSIDPNPVLSVLLEPRSLIVTTSSLYTSHLHGIEELEEDSFTISSQDFTQGQAAVVGSPLLPRIANVDLLQSASVRRVVEEGGTLRRGTRYSLTCRDVEKVANVRMFAM